MEAKAWQAFYATLLLERSKFGLNELLDLKPENYPNILAFWREDISLEPAIETAALGRISTYERPERSYLNLAGGGMP